MKRYAAILLAFAMAVGLSVTASALSVSVRIPTGEDVAVHVEPGTDAKTIMDMVADKEDISPDGMRLLHGSCLIKEESTVESAGIRNGDTLYLLMEYPWESRYGDRYDDDDEYALWVDTLLEMEDSKPGDALHVNIKSCDKVPVFILEGLAGRGISLELIPFYGDSLTLRSDDIVPNWYGVSWYSLDELWDLYG